MSTDVKKIRYSKVKCRIKWFNQFKGYGFVEIENVPGDVFVHFSVLNKAGIDKLSNNDVITCDVEKGDRGLQVTNVYGIVCLNKYEIADREPELVDAVMKWFNPAKGFGFAQMRTGEDVFIHASLLKKRQIESLEHGQKMKIFVRYTNFGYEAMELILDSASEDDDTYDSSDTE